MSILIDTVRIHGFRGLVDFEVKLPRVAVLIGPNNAGKTSVIKAIQLALGDYSRYVSTEDFHIAAEESRMKEILIDIRIVPVGPDGKRITAFNVDWQAELGDKIQADAGNQFVAIRTRVTENMTRGGFDCLRFSLSEWPGRAGWSAYPVREHKIAGKIQSLSFIGIEAQRDIHQELREKSSFAGRILSAIEYDEEDIQEIEALIGGLNTEAVTKSSELSSMKAHLDRLNQSLDATGKTEITPFPKKIRDLSKHFTVHFGEDGINTFSMEYHGMGTRSWASLLTVRAFIELTAQRHKEDARQFFPIIAAEEPEAHLHPNAQKSLYGQLAEISGQVILSSHSPYLVTAADPCDLRSLRRGTGNCCSLRAEDLTKEEIRKLKREVIHSRGDILFSKAIVLCEGETEEQALPLLFEKSFSNPAHELGVSFVGVHGSGARYKPFLTMARDFSIPVFIFSDGEAKPRSDLIKIWKAVFSEEIDLDNHEKITVLEDTDFEGYLAKKGLEAISNTNY